MKSFVFGLAVLALIVVSWGMPEDKYTNKYDGVNVDEVLTNERLLKNYYDCIMDNGKCTTEGQELKSHISDALATKCSKCTDKQREGTEKVIRHLINNKKEWWNELSKKYDPQGKYKKEYEEEAKKRGLNA